MENMKSSMELLQETVSTQKKKIEENKAEEKGKKSLYFSDIYIVLFLPMLNLAFF